MNKTLWKYYMITNLFIGLTIFYLQLRFNILDIAVNYPVDAQYDRYHIELMIRNHSLAQFVTIFGFTTIFGFREYIAHQEKEGRVDTRRRRNSLYIFSLIYVLFLLMTIDPWIGDRGVISYLYWISLALMFLMGLTLPLVIIGDILDKKLGYLKKKDTS